MNARLRATVPCSALAAVLLAASPAFAAWQSSGVPLCATCDNRGYRDPGAAPDGAGGMFGVAWDGSWLMNVRHLSITGDEAPGWPVAGAVVTTIGSVARAPRVAADGAGGVYVAFLSTGCVAHCSQFDFGTLMLQHLTAAGAVAGGWPETGVPADSTWNWTRDQPLPVPDGHGGVIVVWNTNASDPWSWSVFVPGTLHLQRVDAAGRWPWDRAAATTVAPKSDGLQYSPAVAADGAGGAFVAWTDHRTGAKVSKVYLQHVHSNGALADSAGIALDPAACAQGLPQVLADGAGGAYVAWFDSTTATTTELHAQHIAAGGGATWGGGITIAAGIALTTGGATWSAPPAIAPDGAGGVYLSWTDTRTSVSRAYVTRRDGSGHLVAPWPADGAPASSAGGSPLPSLLAADGAGGVYVAWFHGGMIATHLRADGTRAAGWSADGTPLCANGPDYCERVNGLPWYLFADGAGGAVGAWGETRYYPYPNGLDVDRSYAQRIADDGPVASLASLVSADATSARVRIEWWTAAGGALRVLRAVGAAGAGWSPLAAVTPDGAGHVTIDDADVRQGERYGYRLVRATSGADETLAETWVTVPAAGRLRIDGARPNPARGELRLAIELPAGAPAAIELIDAAGRRVLARRADGLGAGAHEVALAGSAALPAGIYLVRLSQAGRTVTTRICVLR